MKIWHDDIRTAPEGWTWARTNLAAAGLLAHHEVDEISLDHDLGLSDLDPSTPGAIFLDGTSSGDTGLDLVRWMCESGHVPAKVTIHSVNPVGARAMAETLNFSGYDCELKPFTHRR